MSTDDPNDFWTLVTGGLYVHGYNMAIGEFLIHRMWERWERELSGAQPSGAITVRRPTREAANV